MMKTKEKIRMKIESIFVLKMFLLEFDVALSFLFTGKSPIKFLFISVINDYFLSKRFIKYGLA